MIALQIINNYIEGNQTNVVSTTKYTEPIVIVGGQTPGVQIDLERNYSPGVFIGHLSNSAGYSMQ